MKTFRWILYAVILGALFLAPLQRIDIANLKPIEAVWMYVENGTVFLETDTNDKGEGPSAEAALENMKNNSIGVVYLDTSQYLFISESAERVIPEVGLYLKGSVKLCIWDGLGEIGDAVKYAESHNLGLELRKWKGIGNLPEIALENLEK